MKGGGGSGGGGGGRAAGDGGGEFGFEGSEWCWFGGWS